MLEGKRLVFFINAVTSAAWGLLKLSPLTFPLRPHLIPQRYLCFTCVDCISIFIFSRYWPSWQIFRADVWQIFSLWQLDVSTTNVTKQTDTMKSRPDPTKVSFKVYDLVSIVVRSALEYYGLHRFELFLCGHHTRLEKPAQYHTICPGLPCHMSYIEAYCACLWKKCR